MANDICSKLGEGCGGKFTARGLCYRHYRQALKSGEIQSQRGTPAERFWAKVDKHGPIPEYRADLGECWLWTAATDSNGYGRFDREAAHRFAYELLIGPIPEGLVTDHLCRVPLCVRVTHLEPVTPGENLRRGAGGVLSDLRAPLPWPTHCAHGHELTERNTYVYQGRPKCRRCSSDRTLRWQRRPRGDGKGHTGERSPAAKLTEADVRYIRASNLSTGWLAEIYGVRPASISNVRLRKTWKHLP